MIWKMERETENYLLRVGIQARCRTTSPSDANVTLQYRRSDGHS